MDKKCTDCSKYDVCRFERTVSKEYYMPSEVVDALGWAWQDDEKITQFKFLMQQKVFNALAQGCIHYTLAGQ